MSTETSPSPIPAGLSATAFSSLFQAVAGLRNRRAIVALLGCLVAGVLLAALLLAMTGFLGMLATLLAALVWLVAIGTGVNAAGLLQMDEARGGAPRSIIDALTQGLLCIPKLIVLGLAFFAVEVAVFIAIALVMLVCKIPFLGPLLFVVAFPLAVVAAGVTLVGIALCVVLSLPAIWQGETITRALAQTMTIVKSRLVETVLLLLFIGLLCFVVGVVVFSVLGAGLLPTLGISASILGFAGVGDMNSLMGASQGADGRGAGLMAAGAVGGLLLWAVAASLVGQVYLRGLALVYLRVTEGLDPAAAEASLRAGLDEAKRRSSELADKARSAAGRAEPPPVAATAAAGVVAPVVATTAAVDPSPSAHYNPPPAYSAPPTPSFDALQSAAFGEIPPAKPSTTSKAPSSVAPGYERPADIHLPSAETPAATPAYAAPPAWTPPPASVQPPPASPAPPAPTLCPQCLSPVTGDDVFCGVCGFRLK